MVTVHPNIPRIKYDGIFDLEGMHNLVKEFMFGEKFDFYENKYKQSAGNFGDEYEIKWTGTREENEYFQVGITVEIHTWDCVPVEVLENGKKVMKTKGRIELKVYGVVNGDWQKRWSKTAILRTMKKIYESINVHSKIYTAPCEISFPDTI